MRRLLSAVSHPIPEGVGGMEAPASIMNAEQELRGSQAENRSGDRPEPGVVLLT